MLKLLRWLRGYARFSISGGPERFLNQCARSGVMLWDMHGGADASACVVAAQYRHLRRCARRSGCRLRLQKKTGLPFRAVRVTKRRGLLAGAVLFVLILEFLGQRVWCVDVQGNQLLTEPQVQQVLQDIGLRPGISCKSVNPVLFAQRIMHNLPQVRWVTVNTQGCVAHVVLEEQVEKPGMDKTDGFYNLTASRVGQIVKMEIYRGTPQVMLGEAVVEGQLLISGIVEDSNGAASLEHAAGRVIAATQREWSTQIELARPERRPTGEMVVRRSVTLFGLQLPLTLVGQPEGDYEREDLRTRFRIHGVELPISFYEERWMQQDSVDVELTQEQALEEARAALQAHIETEWKDITVLDRQETTQVQDGKFHFSVVLKCEENIAVESQIFSGESTS